MTDQPLDRDRGDAYQAFTLPYDQETAVMQFEDRYGYTPKESIELFERYLLVGPVEDIDE